MQFEMVDKRAAGAEDGLVLGGVDLGEFFGKDIADMTADELRFVAEATAFD